MTQKHFGLIISQLSIKNFATFDDQVISFNTGFNAIVGETGSGKSLILDALQLALGQRADRKLIRKNCEFSIVETVFKCHDSIIRNYFNEIGYPFDEDEIIVKRIIYKNGKTKSFLNHQSCSLTTLSNFSKRFVDLVGQFENQKLLSPTYQIQLLDNFSINQIILNDYQVIYSELQETRDELEQKKLQAAELQQKQDYLDFQLNELNKLAPCLEREQELLQKKRLLQNLEENKQAVAEFNFIFDGDHNRPGLSEAITKLENIISDKLLAEEDINHFHNAKEILNDLNYKVNSHSEVDFDEEEFESVLEELDLYQKLKRKYSVDTQGLIEITQRFSEERANISTIELQLNDLENKITSLENEAYKLATELHNRRVSNASKLSKLLSKEIQSLRMKGATIKIELEKAQVLQKNGLSHIHFKAETNPGEGYYLIKEIASGGELSRILLALRTVLSSNDSISIFLFDEIDTGIGGETALSVGKSLQKVALNSQVIAITHLPQIANFAYKLVRVSKEIKDARTISLVKEFVGQKSVSEEVTQMGAIN